MLKIRYASLFLLIAVSMVHAADEAASAPGSAEAEIRKAIDELSKAVATGKAGKIAPLVEFKSDDDKKRFLGDLEIAATMGKQKEAAKVLDQSAHKKFSKPWFPGPIAPAMTQPAATETIAITVDKDHATIERSVGMPGGKKLTVKSTMVKRDGAWRLLMDSLPPARGVDLQKFGKSQGNMAEAYLATATEIDDGKYATIEEARAGMVDHYAQLQARDAKAEPRPKPKPLNWDLTKSHTLTNVDWPKDKTGLPWITEDRDELFEITVKLPGLNAFTVIAPHPNVMREFRKDPMPKELDFTESIGRFEIAPSDYFSAAELKAFVEKLGLNDRIKKQLADWSPDDPKQQSLLLRQPLEGGGGIRIDVINARKFTGEKDSWKLGIQADWGKKPANYWDPK